MTKKRLSVLIALTLVVLVAIGAILYQPAGEVTKGYQATSDGQRAITQLKKGKSPTVTHGKAHAELAVSIPSVGINLPIYKTAARLDYGVYTELAKHDPQTSPGQANYVLAGHSSYVQGVLFSDLFKLTTTQGYVRNVTAPYRPSDYQGGSGQGGLILIYTPGAVYTYQADRAYTVEGNDASILNDPPVGSVKQIHLFTCPRSGDAHPAFRYVVEGHLIKIGLTKLGESEHLDTSFKTTAQHLFQSGTLTSN